MTPPIETGTGFDLHLERIIDAPRDAVWRCWTEADLLGQWYCPKPWKADVHQIDVWPGGQSTMTFRGPDGEEMPQNGMYLFVEPGKTLIFTDGYSAGFVPQPQTFMTGYVLLEDVPGGKTKMIWGAKHSTEDGKKQHEEMGFEQGWGAAADQLSDLAKSLIAA